MSEIKKGHSTLSGLVGSDSEASHSLDIMPTPDSGVDERATRKRGPGRPAKITKTRKATRRTSDRVNGKREGKANSGLQGRRAPLADKTNQQDASETEEVDDFDQSEDVVMRDVGVTKPAPAKKGKSARKGAATIVKPTESNNTVNNHADVLKQQPRKGRPVKKKVPVSPAPEKIIQESQVPVDAEYGVDEEVEETVPKVVRNTAPQSSTSRTRLPSTQRHRAGSASETERNDPAFRRKLGEITKKYEALQLKYQDLREIGLREAERNFEKLRKQSEEKTRISNDLIKALKTDVATQTALAKDSRAIQKKLDSQVAETNALQEQLAQLQLTLSEAHSQNTTLSAKLAANRHAAASVDSANSRVPGSAIKAGGGIRLMGTAEAAQNAQAAQLKEDLYSDLTGLIIRSVKREADEDIFDCIQTGRNGTLHFKLAVGNEKSAESYDDVQCSYTPQLDPSRDEALMELLPDYLVDEITFPRPHAAKFYARVVKALTEKPSEP